MRTRALRTPAMVAAAIPRANEGSGRARFIGLRERCSEWTVIPPDPGSRAAPLASRGRFRKRNLKHAKECSIQQRRGFACGVCRWKRRFGCSRNSAVSAARFESGFRERDGQGQHWRGPHSHGGFLKMIVCESGGHANGLTYFIFRFLRRPHNARLNPSLGVREHFSAILRQVGVGASQKSLGVLKIYAELPGAGQRKGS